MRIMAFGREAASSSTHSGTSADAFMRLPLPAAMMMRGIRVSMANPFLHSHGPRPVRAGGHHRLDHAVHFRFGGVDEHAPSATGPIDFASPSARVERTVQHGLDAGCGQPEDIPQDAVVPGQRLAHALFVHVPSGKVSGPLLFQIAVEAGSFCQMALFLAPMRRVRIEVCHQGQPRLLASGQMPLGVLGLA